MTNTLAAAVPVPVELSRMQQRRISELAIDRRMVAAGGLGVLVDARAQSTALLASGNWLNAGEVFKLHRRLKHPRRNNKACVACNERKVGCDGNRPCGRCVKKGVCCEELRARGEEVQQVVQVERPLQIPSVFFFNESGEVFTEKVRRMLPSTSMRMCWLFGKRMEDVLNVFQSVPDVMIPITKAALAAAEILNDSGEIESGSQSPAGSRSPTNSVTSRTSSSASSSSVKYDNVCDEGDEPSHSFCLYMDKTNLRRVGVSVGHRTGPVTGIHPEETFARLGDRQFKFPTSQVEAFCSTMDDLLNGQSAGNVRFCRWKRRYMDEKAHSPSHQGYHFVRTTAKLERVDEAQDIWKYRQRIDLITPEQFDAAQERHSGTGVCRPLVHLLKDDRSAAELLHHSPHLDTWEGLCATADGRERVRALVSGLEQRFSSLIFAAEQKAGAPIHTLTDAFEVIGQGVPFGGGPTFSLSFPPDPAAAEHPSLLEFGATGMPVASSSWQPGTQFEMPTAVVDNVGPWIEGFED